MTDAKKLVAGTIGAILACAPSLGSQPAEVAARPFTVRDSIELPRIVALDGNYRAGTSAGIVLFSPDRQHVVVRTRRGDLERNLTVDSLLLFATKDLESFLSRDLRSHRPTVNPLIELPFTHDWDAISHVQWLNNDEIGFIARRSEKSAQVFALSITNGDLIQVTQSLTDVASFAIQGDHVVYYAYATKGPLQVIDATDRSFADLLPSDDPTTAPVQLFHSSRSTGRAVQVGANAMRLVFDKIWISPSGDYAISFAPAVNAPPYWSEYRVYSNELFGYSPSRTIDDPTSAELWQHVRYELINLKDNIARPLLDAPSGVLSFNRTPQVVLWPMDRQSVIVSNTYLPLTGTDPVTRKQRAAGPAIAEVDLASKRVQPIMWEPMVTVDEKKTGKKIERIVAIDWDQQQQVLTVSQRRSAGNTERRSTRRQRGHWRPIVVSHRNDSDALIVDRREGLNERPKLYATGGSCACTREIYDPAPTAEQFRFGRAEMFQWLDRNGIQWKGGLIYPVGYVPGMVYPLVVQTHGFHENEFLLDGPEGMSTAFAAQVLANAGFVVLQIAEASRAITLDSHEGSLVAEGYRSAIERLISRRIVDERRVGLIAFSRTGYHAISLLAESPQLLTAIAIADSVQPGYVQDMLAVNDTEVASQIHALNGSSPHEGGYGPWFDTNPMYKLRSTRSAVRIEAIGPVSLTAMWETFAVLRRTDRAVDLIYFPQGSHVLTKPMERVGSQGGTVDWFRFWLQGYEDPDASKTAGYVRWRKLRTMREEQLAAASD